MPQEPELSSLFSSLRPTPNAHTDPLTTPLSACFQLQTPPQISRPMDFFVVAFRSVRGAGADDELLYSLDAEAHAEAIQSGGLLKYWYGTLNERRECLAMCIWRSKEDAVRATSLPVHIRAASVTPQMYKSYTLERYGLQLSPSGGLTFTQLKKTHG